MREPGNEETHDSSTVMPPSVDVLMLAYNVAPFMPPRPLKVSSPSARDSRWYWSSPRTVPRTERPPCASGWPKFTRAASVRPRRRESRG